MAPFRVVESPMSAIDDPLGLLEENSFAPEGLKTSARDPLLGLCDRQ